MKRRTATIFAIALLLICPQNVYAGLYTFDSTVPAAGGCPQPNHFNLALSDPLNRRWSTSLPSLLQPTVLTVAASGTPAQLTEIEGAISDSFGAWSGVTGTTFNATAYPGLVAPLARVAAQNSCSDDAEDNVDGLNTSCRAKKKGPREIPRGLSFSSSAAAYWLGKTSCENPIVFTDFNFGVSGGRFAGPSVKFKSKW
jgi:hypothetical protein